MSEPSSWRDLLSQITSNPTERERLANEIGVRPITLSRWASGESIPRPQNVRQLLYALPQQYRATFLELLGEEHFALSSSLPDDSSSELAYDFVKQVLDARATTPDGLRFWTISHQVLRHALRQLDSERIGMAITVVRCMPPSHEGKIRSLRESVGLGTPPWEEDLEHRAMFLGTESVAGHVVASGHSEAVQDLAHTILIPAYQSEYEVSAMASPILYANRVAGCLLFSSTQLNYFLPQARQSLILGYTRTIALAFEPEEFYLPERIELRMMPPHHVQRRLFAGFQQRVHTITRDAFNTERPLTYPQAEQVAWQQIEEELIRMATNVTRD